MKSLNVAVVAAALFVATATTVTASAWSGVTLPSRPLFITAQGNTMWVCGADEMIAKSSNGGKTWTATHSATSGLLLSMGFATEQFGYAAGTGNKILVTKDGGKTWSGMPGPATVIYELSFADEANGIAHGKNAVFTTADGGKTWAPVKIDLGDDDYKRMSWVSTVVALDAKRMAIVMSEGNSGANHQVLYLTQDGGATWKVNDIAHVGIGTFYRLDGEYWITGHEVIEWQKPGGGYGVPLAMHSADGMNWTHLDRWEKKEFSACNDQGCLYWDGAGIAVPPSNPPIFWTFAAEKIVTSKWAVAQGGICSVSTDLKCTSVIDSPTMPSYVESSASIASRIFAPPLNTPVAGGLQCISCDTERIVVTQDYQGFAEVDLKLLIGTNGLVQKVEITKATNAGIGDRVAASARNWIFVPYEQDGVLHPASMNVRLQIQAIKSK